MEHEGRCVGNRVNAYTSDMDFHGGSKLSKLTYPIKTIYSKEAREKLRLVLDDFKPDVCHLNNFNHQLTPSIILEIVKWRKETGRDCKIIFTAHDYQLVWGVAVVALVFNLLCGIYFFDGNHIVDAFSVGFTPRLNIVYDAIYFIAGGLIFLYRKELAEFASKYKVIAEVVLLIATVAYFALGGNTLTMLFFCVAALVYTLGCKRGGVLVNPVAKFLGGISFEIYLCHMVIYRVLEKLHLVHLFGNGLLAYIFTVIAVICGSVVFSVCAKWFLNKIETFLKERVNNRRVNHV